MSSNELPVGQVDAVVAVADQHLRIQCVLGSRDNARLVVLAVAADIAAPLLREHNPAVVVVGANDRTAAGISAIAAARDFFPYALVVPVTEDDLPDRLMALAAVGATEANDDPLRSLLSGESIRMAIDAGQPDLVVQPIVDLRDGRLVGFEVLARFRAEPQCPPHVWFDVAHRLGLGIELERATLRRGCRAVNALAPDLFLALNVSPRTVLAGDLESILDDASRPQLVLEITEHARVDDYWALRRALTRLRTDGVRVAVDDVGAGFSTLRHVLRLDPDIIKLDQDITLGVEHDVGRAKLVGGLIAGASAVSTLVVAEGIETEAQMLRLRELGVRGGQGYYIARPGDLDEAIQSGERAATMLRSVPTTNIQTVSEPRWTLSGARILVVDDSVANRTLVRATFELEGAVVHEAATAAEATQALKSATYDLVLLDVRLPDGNGFDVLEHIRRTSNLPVLFVTAATAVSDRVAGFDKGADDYLLKPFSPEELVARVDAALRRRLTGTTGIDEDGVD